MEVTIENYNGKVLLGIDYGHKKTGLAIYRWGIDPCPTPYLTIFQSDLHKLLAEILSVISDECIDVIICGLPKHADNSDSQSTIRVKNFSKKLEESCPLPIHFQDEHLSSYEAKQRMQESHLESFEDGYVDKLAATIILEDFIKSLH